jgi:eukaryotic-like serine/threonine-protein kinase
VAHGDEHSWLDGRYELGEIIGRGGMSTVYRSHDHRTGRDVAVKIFRPGPDLNDADQRYRREVLLLAGLRDSGLVTVFDADLDDPDSPYLVTELVHGPTLSEQITQAPLSEAQAGRLGAALARTLAYVHGHGIIHRDVKPANILLPALLDDQFAAPKLVDFGIAIAADATRLTGANLTLGTANYLSPEQIRGATVTSATDVYSLGIVLIEALTGQPAYPGHGIEAAMARLDHPPAVAPTVGDELRALLTAMTAADARERPGAAQVAKRLDHLNASRATEIVPLAGPGAAVAIAARDAGEPGAALVPAARPGDDVEPGAHVADWKVRRRQSSWPRTIAVGGALIIAALFGLATIASFTGHKAPAPVKQTPSPQAAPTSAHSAKPKLVRTTKRPSPTVAVAPPLVVDPPVSAAASPSSISPPTSRTTSRAPSTPPSSPRTPTTSAPSRSSAPPSPPSPPSSPSSPPTPSSPTPTLTPTPTPTPTTSPPPPVLWIGPDA